MLGRRLEVQILYAHWSPVDSSKIVPMRAAYRNHMSFGTPKVMQLRW